MLKRRRCITTCKHVHSRSMPHHGGKCHETVLIERPRMYLTLVRLAASCWHATAAPRRGGPRRGFDVSCKLAQLGYKVGFFSASFSLTPSLSLSLSLSLYLLVEHAASRTHTSVSGGTMDVAELPPRSQQISHLGWTWHPVLFTPPFTMIVAIAFAMVHH
jgi:hypothetical protein